MCCACVFVSQWKCCGVIGYNDWHEAFKEKVVPDRCCQEHYQNCGRNSTNMFWNQVSARWLATWKHRTVSHMVPLYIKQMYKDKTHSC